jgi:hypothetical protein
MELHQQAKRSKLAGERGNAIDARVGRDRDRDRDRGGGGRARLGGTDDDDGGFSFDRDTVSTMKN